jgi:hypothetical protein
MSGVPTAAVLLAMTGDFQGLLTFPLMSFGSVFIGYGVSDWVARPHRNWLLRRWTVILVPAVIFTMFMGRMFVLHDIRIDQTTTVLILLGAAGIGGLVGLTALVAECLTGRYQLITSDETEIRDLN